MRVKSEPRQEKCDRSIGRGYSTWQGFPITEARIATHGESAQGQARLNDRKAALMLQAFVARPGRKFETP